MSIARTRRAVHPEPAAPQKVPPAHHAALPAQPQPKDQLRPRGLGRIPRTTALAKTLLQLGNQICPQAWVPASIPIPRGPGNIAHKDPVSTCRSGRLTPLCPSLMPPHHPRQLPSQFPQRKAKGVGGVGSVSCGLWEQRPLTLDRPSCLLSGGPSQWKTNQE